MSRVCDRYHTDPLTSDDVINHMLRQISPNLSQSSSEFGTLIAYLVCPKYVRSKLDLEIYTSIQCCYSDFIQKVGNTTMSTCLCITTKFSSIGEHNIRHALENHLVCILCENPAWDLYICNINSGHFQSDKRKSRLLFNKLLYTRLFVIFLIQLLEKATRSSKVQPRLCVTSNKETIILVILDIYWLSNTHPEDINNLS